MSSDAPVAVITGASAGIGAAAARRLAREGFRVVLAARRPEALEKLAQELGGAARARAVVTDVTHRDQVERLRDAALEAFGRIDVWINNAGRGISRPVLELTDRDVDDMITVNLKSALYGMQAVVPWFIEQGRGHVINISSFLARIPLASQRSAYSAAKAALNSLTANLRMDLKAAAPGVHVTTVMPGVVTTDFARNAGGPGTGPTPVIRPGGTPLTAQSAEEVAEVIAQVVAHPVAEAYTNPAQPAVVQRYYTDVGAFERASP